MKLLAGLAITTAVALGASQAAAVEVYTNATFGTPVATADISTSHATSANATSEQGLQTQSAADATVDSSGAVFRAKVSVTGTLAEDALGSDDYVAAVAMAGITDTILISSAGLEGSAGRVGFTLNYDGILHGEGLGGHYNTNAYGVVCDLGPGCMASSLQLSILELETLEGSALQDDLDVQGAAVPGFLDFTYGVPFEYSLYLFVSALVQGPAGTTFDVQSDFFHTATLGILNVYDAAGARDGAAIVTSTTSDLAYAVAVPEPSAWALMIMGFGATGAMIRNRRKTLISTYG
ncbi:PEPxxWA-CTERM sorting domain-containing protein [uncultured Phenylobacterium sp.]|uniref:PEPxxWA-CTERM sorting domain-containing protein n=1 Tax=uncultured Phenylobacterium sp. TaxID=349273 RepID=UPI0025DEF516|nr:PEPxxWA-CTERM sorting domain-containing protein [uncultured Phenylobacterium sp.]